MKTQMNTLNLGLVFTALTLLAFDGVRSACAQQIVTNIVIPSYLGNIAVNPALNKIYLAGGEPAGQMVAVDGATFNQTGVGTGSSIDVDATNNNYWSTGLDSGYANVWSSSNSSLSSISLGYCPSAVSVDAPHRMVWVGAQCGDGNDPVWAINADTYGIIAGPIGNGGDQGSLVVNPATGRLYINPSGVSKRVNPSTYAVTTNAFGTIIGVNARTNRLYAFTNSTKLQIINGSPDPEVVLTTVTLAFTLNGSLIGVNPALNRIYVQKTNAVVILNGSTGATIGTAVLAGVTGVGQIAVDASRNRIYAYASGGGSNFLYVIQDAPSASPTIFSFAPTNGVVGTVVIINGTNFNGTTAVGFGGVNASFTNNSKTNITALVPTNAVSGFITVVTTNGTAASFNIFNVIYPPVITAQPLSCTNNAGSTATFTVTASGTTPAYQWFKSSLPITGAVSATLTLTNVQDADMAGYTVVLTNVAGSVTSAPPATLTVIDPPVITGFSPASGSPGTAVTVSGTNFTATTFVTFNGAPAVFSINSDNQITATVPSCAGSGPVAVTDSAGTATTAGNFSFIKQPMTITINSPIEASLDTALCNGSTVILAFDGVIAISSTKVVTSDVILDGTGHNVTISGSNNVGVFIVNSGVHLTLRNLTVANGYAIGGGGGILNNGIVTLDSCTFSNNVAVGTTSGNGGAIDNGFAGTLVANNCTFVSNCAAGGTSANGYVIGGGGGGILNNGIATLDNCTFSNNVAVGTTSGNGTGGAIFNGPAGRLVVNDCTFASNRATGGTGGGGANGAGEYGAGHPGDDGGVGLGGGIYNNDELSGSVTITNCTFYNNQAIGGNGGRGGGGYNGYSYEYICGSYKCGFNTCYDYCWAYVYGGPGGNGGNGGTGYGGNLYNNYGSVTAVNTTFANGSVSGGTGGPPGLNGALNQGGNGVEGINGSGVGGNLGQGAGPFVLHNCIIANATSGKNYWGGSITDAGNNLSSDTTLPLTSANSSINTNPNLGLLTNNGGPTWTMALLPASPAVRAGDTNGAPTTDQRGQPRKALQIDIGAYETPVIPSGTPSILNGTKTAGASPFWLTFTNTPGTSFSIWSSTNLLVPFSNWTFIGFAREIAPGQFLSGDSSSTNNPWKFYRVQSP
jgi:hypothetical protein